MWGVYVYPARARSSDTNTVDSAVRFRRQYCYLCCAIVRNESRLNSPNGAPVSSAAGAPDSKPKNTAKTSQVLGRVAQ